MKKVKELSKKDILKIEIAKELGLWEKIEQDGWGGINVSGVRTYWRTHDKTVRAVRIPVLLLYYTGNLKKTL